MSMKYIENTRLALNSEKLRGLEHREREPLASKILFYSTNSITLVWNLI